MKKENQTLPCGRPAPSDTEHSLAQEGLAEIIEKLNAFVAKKKLNKSAARVKILEMIVKETPHFRAQDLLLKLKKRHPDIGRATVYRNLPVFVESGLIQEGPTDSEGQILYELTNENHHDHIVCVDCGKIFEFHDDLMEARQEQVIEKLGFTEKDHRHVIYASCDALAKQKTKNETRSHF